MSGFIKGIKTKQRMSVWFCSVRLLIRSKKMLQGANCRNCHLVCGKGNVSPEILTKLDNGYTKLIASDSKSLLKKYLTKDVFTLLRDVQTPMGSSLLDCIQSGKFFLFFLLKSHFILISF